MSQPEQALPQPTSPRAWLEHFPRERRSAIANWFHYSCRSGITVPASLLVAVESTARRHLGWQPEPSAWEFLVIEKLHSDRRGAMAFAGDVIEYNAMPYDQQQQVKAERAWSAIKEHMREKDATPKQLAYLRVLGYRGSEPANQAEASELIDQFIHQQGGMQ